MIAYSYIREEIVINATFVAELDKELAARKIPANSTLLIAARSIRHARSYVLRLDNYNLILAADEYTPAGGAIDLGGRNGATGAKGSNGAPGTVSASGSLDKPGGNGGAGGHGSAPTKGNTLKLFCRDLHGATLLARGGQGGVGGAGGNGGNGGSGKRVVVDPEGGKSTELIGTNGGNGGNGGNASAGAPGGQISVCFVSTPPISPLTMTVTGGDAAAGGARGLAGAAGPDALSGQPGKPGLTSTKGANGSALAKKLDEPQFWAALRAELGAQLASAWASYRVRTGEYNHRIAAGANHRQNLSRAFVDYDAAKHLDPASPAAGRLAGLHGGLNPLGLRRDLYLVPDFTRYESAFTAYAPLVQSMLGDARNLLLYADNVGANKQRMSAQRDHFQAQKAVVASELAEANLELTHAQSAVQEISTRINAVRAEIKVKEKELMEASASLNGEFIGTMLAVIGAVAAVAGACFTGGASLAALPAIFIAAESAWSRISKDSSGDLKYDGRPLADIVQWEDKDGKFSPKLKPEIAAQAAGLKDVVQNGAKIVSTTLDLIDKVKLLNDISLVQVSGGGSELKELLRRSAQLELDRAQGQVAIEIVKIRVQTIQLRGKQVDADIAAAQQMVDTLTNNTVTLGRAARMIVRRAQTYMEVLMRFHFFAARALEIYTYKDSGGVDYSLGWLAPDLEEDAYMRLERGESGAVLELLQAYLASWAKLPGIIALRSSYETYRQNLGTQSEFWTLEGASLQPFIQTGSVELEISAEALLGEPFECKIDGTSAALVGAVSTLPFIPCVLMHGGTSTVRLLGGVEIAQDFAPRGAALQAVKSEAGITQVAPSPPESFWGRSPATRWRLYIQPEALAKVELAGLSKIVIGVSYKGFIPALGIKAPPSRS